MKITEQVTFIYTADLDATSHFYGVLMGFPLVHDQGACRIYKSCDNSFIGFCKKAEPPKIGDVILTFVTDDVDAYYERLNAADVEIVKSPQHNDDYAIYHFFARDPNGYLVEVQCFDDPGWKD